MKHFLHNLMHLEHEMSCKIGKNCLHFAEASRLSIFDRRRIIQNSVSGTEMSIELKCKCVVCGMGEE